jgi:hypothetical protein
MNITLPANYTSLTPKQKREVREKYIELQKGLCYNCNYPLYKEPPEYIKQLEITPKLYPPNFFKYPVHLHHSHETGLTLGAVHNYCNAILWEYFGE